MRHHIHRPITLLALVALLAAAVPGQAAEPLHLLAPAPGDLAARELVVPVQNKALPPVSHDPVTFSWALRPDETIDTAPAPHITTSREYWQRVTASQLRNGVIIETTAPGALVRVNPVRRALTDELAAIDPHSLVLSTRDGRVLREAEGMSQLATPEELAQAGVPFPAGTSAFRLSKAVGAGEIVIQAPDLPADSQAVYVVHVFDKESPAVLELQAARDVFFAGDLLEATAGLEAAGQTLTVRTVQAELISPDGTVTPLETALRSDGTVAISGALASRELAGPGLWEVHASVTGQMGELTVRRDARTAFSYTVPTARLTGEAVASADANGLRIGIGVEAAAAGRYEVSAVLFGTGEDGRMYPAVRADAAAWLEPGTGTITLAVDGPVLAATGLQPPFELRDLRLKDQGRMQVLHRQARAAVLDRAQLAGLRTGEGRLD